MSRKTANKMLDKVQILTEEFGEAVLDAVNEDDNFPNEIVKGIINVIADCKTDRDLEIADKMLIAVCGYSMETLVSRI